MFRSMSNLLRKASVHQIKDVPVNYTQGRYIMMKVLNSVLSIYDNERVNKFGPDRACAEWILKTGGRVRWKGSEVWVDVYNALPSDAIPEDLGAYKLQDIDASGSVLMSQGFRHLDNLKDLKSMKLHDCKYLNDGCLGALQTVAECLEQLQVSSCKNVTDKGLMHLTTLENLTDLHLKDLPGVKDPQGCCERLQRALPNCDIMFLMQDKKNT